MKEQAELGRLMDDVNETAQRIKTRLTNLDAAIKEKAASDSDANARIKRTLHASSQKKVPLPWRTLLPAFKNRFLRAVHGLHDALPNCANKVSHRPSITWSPALHQRRAWKVACASVTRLQVQRHVSRARGAAVQDGQSARHAAGAIHIPRAPRACAPPSVLQRSSCRPPQQVSEVLEGDGSAIFATMSVGALAGD
jgi:hypothetical protein